MLEEEPSYMSTLNVAFWELVHLVYELSGFWIITESFGKAFGCQI